MLDISLAEDVRRFSETLTDFSRTQLPFATVRALTRTVQIASDQVVRGLPLTFDRPTPWTMKSIGIETAKKSTMQARVFVKDLQTPYLLLQEEGGFNQPKKVALVTPKGVRLNRYGNIAHRALAKAKARVGKNGQSKVFVGTIKGVGGFWERDDKNGTVRLLVRFEGAKKVTPHPFFFPAVETIIRRDFDRILLGALEDALATARP